MKKRTKRLLRGAVVAGCLAMATTFGVCYATRGQSGPALGPPDGHLASVANLSETPSPAETTLRVMTLNLAHGRAERVVPFVRRSTAEEHLDAVARLIDRQQPDVVALQEADGPSVWSGRLDHVAYLAERSGFGDYCRGEHVEGLKLAYGTALLARRPLADCRSVAFAPSPPTFTKGFVVATIPWPGRPERPIDVVSVHLDFARGSVRRKQARAVLSELSSRGRPMIVMGDFNSEWTDGGPLATLAGGLGLKAHAPDADWPTFSATGKRLDWILLSRELEFVAYETLPDAVSDHRGVVAVLRLVAGE